MLTSLGDESYYGGCASTDRASCPGLPGVACGTIRLLEVDMTVDTTRGDVGSFSI